MRRSIATLLGLGGLLLGVCSAGAESYRIVDGRLEHADGGASEALEGRLEISVFEVGDRGGVAPLRVDDFELRAGGREFGPRQPVEFEDYTVLFLQIADQIQFDGDEVGFWYLRSGGDLVAGDESEVTLRFADFRADGPDSGELIGQVGDGPLPRRLTLTGTLYEVDQHFLIPTRDCPVIPLPPRDGGGVIIGGGAVITSGGTGVEYAPFGGVAFQSAAAPIPTLAGLGITAPSGAELSFDAAGALSVRSTGDLVVAGGTIDVPGLTSLTLETPGRITIESPLELPPDVALTLVAGEVVIDGDLPGAGVGEVDPPPIGPIPFCGSLWATFPPEERALAHVTLVATAARPVGIAVEPRHGGRYGHSRHGTIEVAILGEEDFDVRDVEERSLRLGPGEAEPSRHRGLGRTRRIDVDRDGETDLLVRFDESEAGIPEGAAELCLWGELRDGSLIEGCAGVAAPQHQGRGERGCSDDDDQEADSRVGLRAAKETD